MKEVKTIKVIPLLLFVNIIVTIVGGYFAITVSIKLNRNQLQTLNNQYTNSKALETFIRDGLVCTATSPPNPNPTPVLIKQEGEKCFPNTPEIQ